MTSMYLTAPAVAMEMGRQNRRRRRRSRSTDDVPMMTTESVVVAVVVMMSVVVCVVDSSSIASIQDGDRPLSSSSSSSGRDIYEQQGTEGDDYSRQPHDDCQTENGNCLSDQPCCHGFICSRHQESGSSSSESGICRPDPNLSFCHSDDQCTHGSQCIDSDGTGQGFCQTGQTTQEEQRHKDWSQHMYHERKGGLGSGCESTSDCKPFTMDGQDRLCCQDVRRGRQGTKRMCDRMTGISVCLH